MEILDALRAKCKKRGVTLTIKENGHYQLKGDLLVNWYPHSKNQTAYVAGTTQGFKHVSLDEVIKMTQRPPPKLDGKVKRKKSYKEEKRVLLARDSQCCYCGCELTLKTATIEHVIPLSRGGLENMNNYKLA